MENDFFYSLGEAAEKLVSSKGIIRIISHNDCDGITAAAILVKALKRLDKSFVVGFVKNLTNDVIKEISYEAYQNVVFLDLGSGSLEYINNLLKDRDVFVFDHHQFIEADFNGSFINPHAFNVDGETGISAAGISYLLAKTIDSENIDSAYLAIIGAIGDMQENRGFSGLNRLILEDSLSQIEIKTGLRLFGYQTRPLHKILEYSTEIFIPGVTGDEKGSISFLQNLDIPLQDKLGKYRRLSNLTSDEIKRLVSGIILERMKSEKSSPEDVLGSIYLLKNEKEDEIYKDLREFSTLLNACARLNKASIGLGVCLNDSQSKEQAREVMTNYKMEIINSLNWFHKNRKTGRIIELENLTMINAEEYIKDTLIGTTASILSKSNIYKSGTIIIAMAHTVDGFTKISARISGNCKEISLRNMLQDVIKIVGGQTGGHENAAGAIISQEKDDQFITEVKNYLGKVEQVA